MFFVGLLVSIAFAGTGITEYTEYKVTGISNRYVPAGNVMLFEKEVGVFTVEENVYQDIRLLSTNTRTISLNPGERIADGLFSEMYSEQSYLFYRDDRGLGKYFSQITSSKQGLNSFGKLSYEEIEGKPASKSIYGYLGRKDFKYDMFGRLKAYNAYLDLGPYFPLKVSIVIDNVEYGSNGKISGFVYKATSYFPKTRKVYNIKYNSDGEVISYSEKN